MPKLEVSDTELAIISHALELFLQRYKKSQEHWRWFARKYKMMGAKISLQGPYDGLEDAFQSFVETADSLVIRIDKLLVETPARRSSPHPRTMRREQVEKTMIIQRPKAKGKRANTKK